MWFHHHLKMVIVVRVVFTYYKWRSFFFLSLSLRTLSLAPGKKNMLWKLQFSQLFWSTDWEYREVFCLFFVFYAHSHCSVLPRSDLGCALALWGLQGINIFFLQIDFLSACCCYWPLCLDILKTTCQLWRCLVVQPRMFTFQTRVILFTNRSWWSLKEAWI